MWVGAGEGGGVLHFVSLIVSFIFLFSLTFLFLFLFTSPFSLFSDITRYFTMLYKIIHHLGLYGK